MRKNKVIWSIALFLIIIAALPVAYAQFAPTGSRIYFVLINAAIIFAVLFALQTFLIPQKNDKEKTSIWIIILLASLLVAFLYGQEGFMWQGPLGAYFNIYVLVNSTIIAAVLYFALEFLEVSKKLQSNEGKAGYGLLIFLFSVMISINIAPGMFLWKQEMVRSAAGFLFSSDRGILNPNSGLMVFVTSFILISFFFNNFLLKQGKQTLNYALALIFAVNLAMPPVNPIRDVIQMGEIIFILIVWTTLKDTVPSDKPWAAFLLAILLVGWASAALSINAPQNRGVVAQFICNTPLINCKTEAGAAAAGLFSTTKTTLYVILGGLMLFWMFGGGGADKKKYSGWGIGIGLVILILIYMWTSGVGFIGKIGLGLASILVGIGVILYGIGRGEKRNRIWNEGLTRLKKEVTNFISRHKLLNRILSKIFSLRDSTLEGEIPFKLKELRFEIYTLMNLLLRYDVYYSKWNSFDITISKVTELEQKLQTRVSILESPAESIKALVEGSDIMMDTKTGIWKQVGKFEVNEEGEIVETNEPRMGFARQHWLIYQIMFHLKDLLEPDLRVMLIGDAAKQIEEVKDNFNTYLNTIRGHRTTFYKRYKSNFERFSIASVLKSQRLYFLDMYNLYGKYKRGYFFAKPDAVPDLYEYNTKSEDGGITKRIIIKKDERSGEYKVMYIITPEERKRFKEIKLKSESARTEEEKQFVQYIEGKIRGYLNEYGANREKSNPNYFLELDLFGYCIADWNAVTIDGEQRRYIRRYHREDMWEIYKPNILPRPRFAEMFGWALIDWENYKKDMGRGSFHPYSKKLSDYDFISEEGLLDYTKATFKGPSTPDDLAFDREGLKAFHSFVYWGRRNYYDTDSINLVTLDKVANPYPVVSLGGLWGFIKKVATIKIEETKIAKQFLQELQMEYGQLEELEKGGKKSD